MRIISAHSKQTKTNITIMKLNKLHCYISSTLSNICWIVNYGSFPHIRFLKCKIRFLYDVIFTFNTAFSQKSLYENAYMGFMQLKENKINKCTNT